jgi:hypothetical protein
VSKAFEEREMDNFRAMQKAKALRAIERRPDGE